VGTSKAATRGTPLAVCHAANLAWATVHYCVENAFVTRGTTPKMPLMCEVISDLYCTFICSVFQDSAHLVHTIGVIIHVVTAHYSDNELVNRLVPY